MFQEQMAEEVEEGSGQRVSVVGQEEQVSRSQVLQRTSSPN